MTTHLLGVVLLTYNRLEYAEKTLISTLDNLDQPTKEALHVHIASDGDSPAYINRLVGLAEAHPRADVVTVSNSERRGYGANYNMATQAVHEVCDYVLMLEDDWQLMRPLNAYALIEDMDALGIGCARLGYLGYTQQLRGHLEHGKHCDHWLRFDPYSPEPHVFAGHPRIESRAWSRLVGAWPEGELPGATEFAVAHLAAARQNVAWPMSLIAPGGDLYAHIGTQRSY